MTLRSGEVSVSENPAPEHDTTSPNNTTEVPTGSRGCSLCHMVFTNVVEQRQHAKSDLHRYNFKLKLKGFPSVDETTFTKLVGELDESLSGSESSSSSDELEEGAKPDETTLSALLKRQAKIAQREYDEDSDVTRAEPGVGKAPLLWMSSSKLPGNVSLGVYRAMLPHVERNDAQSRLVDIVKQKQLQPIHAKHSNPNQANDIPTASVSGPHIFLCMIGGGHFAAMVVALAPQIRQGPGGSEERHAILKAHKTFHRYTTRRKQGGSQSANDNAKGNAHSAGSSIRRYNEAALETDVRNILMEWKSMIDTADLLFIRATGTTNRRTLFGPYHSQVLRSTDKRIRGFPFSTRRATQAELMRSFSELTRLKVSTVTKAALQSGPEDESSASKSINTIPAPKVVTPRPSKEEEVAMLHTSQLQALIRRSKVPAVKLYLAKNGLAASFFFYPPSQNRHAPTLLHLAASHSSPALVLALLVDAKADPTVVNSDGKTAFDFAGDSKTRLAFRVARYTLGESAFDWQAAHVQSPISQAEADSKLHRELSAADAAEGDRRKAEIQKLKDEEEVGRLAKIERRAGVGRNLGLLEKTGAEKREEESRGMTPEMRAKMERERRARAAEDRIRRTQGRH